MPIGFRLMGEKAGVDPAQLASVLESVVLEAIIAKTLIESNEPFYLVPAVISRIDTALMAVKSGMSVMALTAITQGVDFIAQSEWKVPNTNDRTSGEDPVYGRDGNPDRPLDGEPTEGPLGPRPSVSDGDSPHVDL